MVSTTFAPHSPFRSILLLLVAIFTISSAVGATQVMRRPEGYKNTPTQVETVQVSPQIIHKRANSHVQAAYFTNWGIYGANFQPTNITPSDLTHILYAFADVSSSTGAISLTDSYADEQKHYPGDSWSEPGNNLYGCLKQLYLLKLANRNLKVLLSIGGWTYSQAGHFSFVTDATSRATFVSSAVQLIKDYGFDGIDLDFEYPSNSAEGQGFAGLLTTLRTAFSQLETSNGDTVPYELTAAVSAGAPNYAYYVVPQMDQALSYWNLMSYDYAGSWLTWADNQANLYDGSRTNVSTDAAIKHYLASGATANKINMGIPLYGRAFENTNGIGDPYSGIGPGTIQAGIYSYKDLPLAGAQVFENTTDVTSYSYDSTKKELVSYDVPDIVKIKAEYVVSNNLAGTMFWDLSTDSTGSTSLVATAAGVYSSLDQTQNHINYPSSKWDNIRNNMNGSNSPPTSTTATQTSTASSTPTSPSGSGSCAGVGAWGSGTVYTAGQTATYNGHLWTAKWWTQGDTPGGSAGAWTDNGACTSSKRSMRFRF